MRFIVCICFYKLFLKKRTRAYSKVSSKQKKISNNRILSCVVSHEEMGYILKTINERKKRGEKKEAQINVPSKAILFQVVFHHQL